MLLHVPHCFARWVADTTSKNIEEFTAGCILVDFQAQNADWSPVNVPRIVSPDACVRFCSEVSTLRLISDESWPRVLRNFEEQDMFYQRCVSIASEVGSRWQ